MSKGEHIGPVSTLYRNTWPYMADNIEYSRVPRRVFTLRGSIAKQHLTTYSQSCRTVLVQHLELGGTELSLARERVEFSYSGGQQRPATDKCHPSLHRAAFIDATNSHNHSLGRLASHGIRRRRRSCTLHIDELRRETDWLR